MPLCPMKWWSFKDFAKLNECRLLIANIVEGTVSGLRHIRNKNNEKYFLFYLKSSLKIFNILS